MCPELHTVSKADQYSMPPLLQLNHATVTVSLIVSLFSSIASLSTAVGATNKDQSTHTYIYFMASFHFEIECKFSINAQRPTLQPPIPSVSAYLYLHILSLGNLPKALMSLGLALPS